MASNQIINSKKFKTFSIMFQECSNERALNPGKQAHARMLISGFFPTIFVTNCLIQMYIRCSSFDDAVKVFNHMPQKDTVTYNAMIFGYAGCQKMATARYIFDSMLERDVVSWNSIISGYLQNGDYQKPVDLFLDMRRLDLLVDPTTLAVILKACSSLEDLDFGVQIHAIAIKMGYIYDVVPGSALIDMYAKCKGLDDSLQFFNEMPEKNWVSWSAIIAGCTQNDQLLIGLKLFKEMQKEGLGISQSTYASIFRSCAGLSALKLGSQLHAHALKSDLKSDVIVGTATLDMYSKCDSILDARKLFNSMRYHSLQSYNAIITGYARNNHGIEPLHLFKLLMKSGLGFDEISLSGAFSACSTIKRHLEGSQLHGIAIKSSYLISNICVANALVDMYGKCEALNEACMVFDDMVRRDSVSWNSIIAAHEQNDNNEETLSLFVSMLRLGMEPDEFTYGSVLKACAGNQALNFCMEIHTRVIKSKIGFDSFLGSVLIDTYCKCGMMEEAEKLHNRIEEQTTISWNSIISGFSLQKQSEASQKFFSWMLEMGLEPDNFTYATMLDTCADMANIGLGRQIHSQIIKRELTSDVYITSTLVDMYSKCGIMEESHLVFQKAFKRDFVTWNSLLCGYAHHGLAEEALKVFEKMQRENVRPNHTTFLSVLRACAHIGLVDKGLFYFDSMLKDYGLDPQVEHYSCMVDIIGRSGRVDQALKLIYNMPLEADCVVWRTLLSVCKIIGNVEVAEIAAKSILELDNEDSSTYVLLANIYANANMWEKVSKMRKTMKYNRLKKEPGCSWIEVKDEVHTFLVGDKAHPRWNEIYAELGVLLGEMKSVGYAPHGGFLLIDIETEQSTEFEM